MTQATPRQRWALFCITKQDYRDVDITSEEASRIISQEKEKLQTRDSHFASVWTDAMAEGLVAGVSAQPTPMIVEQHTDQMDDSSPVAKSWYVPNGVCGFAWVSIGPANHPFCRWLKKNGCARNAYGGGLYIWIREHGQSYERKLAHAEAMAQVISQKIDGLKYCHAAGKLD